MTTDYIWLICIGLLAVALWLIVHETKAWRHEVVSDVQRPLVVDFILQNCTEKGWYGTFVDKIVKYGVITNLGGDVVLGLSKGDPVRVTVDGMKDGLWQAKVFILSNLPRDAIVLTYKDAESRWHCMYPGPQGVAMCGIVDHTPVMLVEKFAAGRVLRARCVVDRHFEIV